jgi:CheY-like chemotaxis protein
VSTPPTLLLADDSLTIQRVVSLTFADQPVRVVVAKDGQDAINRMSAERPDLVLADTNMPCVDGYELARWVRQQPHLSTVPVLLLAGVTDPVDEQRLHDSGANGVLEKPFEPSHVISRVKELLGIKGAPPPARLVTAPDLNATPVPPARKSSPSRPAAGTAAERTDTVATPAPPTAVQSAPGATDARFFGSGPGVPTSPGEPASPFGTEPAGAVQEIDDLGAPRGDARDWFGGDTPAPGSTPSSLAEELGVSDVRFYGQDDTLSASRGLDGDVGSERRGHPRFAAGADRGPGGDASTADVFQSLLAAEQGDPARPVVVRAAAPELTPEMLDYLAARVVERLRPNAMREELQRGLGMGLRETVAQSVRESVVAETRAAVAEAVQAAVNGAILGSVRGAINEAVAGAVPAAVAQQVSAGVVAQELRDALAPIVQHTVREVVEVAVRGAVADAVAAAVPAAVLDAVRGDAGGQVRQIVHETADRLIRDEIARIRERRA